MTKHAHTLLKFNKNPNLTASKTMNSIMNLLFRLGNQTDQVVEINLKG